MSKAWNWKRWTCPACLVTSLCVQPTLTSAAFPAEIDEAPAVSPSPFNLIEDSPAENKEATSAVGSPLEQNPAPVELAPEATPEVVEERYPDGKIKISREVVQDALGNYLNHGTWKMFNERGGLVIEGQYHRDSRCGVWNRWYAAGELPMLRERPFTDFTPPFISQGTFTNDALHGSWTIYDAKHRKICEIQFENGDRQGRATWYYANGQRMRNLQYENGILHGDATDWKPDGSVAKVDKYDRGRKQSEQTTYHKGNVKKTVSQVLEAELHAKTRDDWWKGEFATYEPHGVVTKHGKFYAWHPNGQMMMQGEYKYDLPVGTFTWWYSNGQKSIEGSYEDGLQEEEWCWWHENGIRSIRGGFYGGNPSGAWTWWNKEGKVVQTTNFSGSEATVIDVPKNADEPRQATFPRLFPGR